MKSKPQIIICCEHCHLPLDECWQDKFWQSKFKKGWRLYHQDCKKVKDEEKKDVKD